MLSAESRGDPVGDHTRDSLQWGQRRLQRLQVGDGEDGTNAAYGLRDRSLDERETCKSPTKRAEG